LLTGATRGIGRAAALALAREGAHLCLVARDNARAASTVADIAALPHPGTAPPPDVLIADLTSQASVRDLAAEVLERYPKLDVLVNNAGAIYSSRTLSVDGYELTWALNHLAPFLLTNLLLERLRDSAPARIVTTSSGAHNGAHIAFDDINAEHSYRGFRRYGETKLANILFTAELGRRLGDCGVTANCFHPGLVATGFNRNNGRAMNLAMTLVKPFARSPQKGAETLVALVSSPAFSNEQGGYFFDERRVEPSPAAQDTQTGLRLWELSAQQTGLAG
jgi:NAD(P)-dependent dehydrogenase (short-subunit alcohol dehydrogenase family)